jgi:predicted DNA-binding transcriptional regulator AlpA
VSRADARLARQAAATLERQDDAHADPPPKLVIAAWPAGLTEAMTCAYLGISRTSLWRGVSAGTIPKPVTVTGRRIWRRDDLDQFLADLTPEK